MPDVILQISSMAGALMILGAFVCLQRGLTSSAGSLYLWANFVGSTLLAVVAVADRRLGFILLEGVWALVSLWSIARPAMPSTR